MSEYADIKYSKDLAELFPAAKMWWNRVNDHHVLGHKVDMPKSYPAITIQMALDVLPKIIIPKYTRYDIKIGHFVDQHLDKYWHIEYLCTHKKMANDDPDRYIDEHDKSLQNALCKMIQYLRKEGLL